MKLNLLYVHQTAIGYARYGVKLADALERMGVEVDDTLDPGHRDPSNVACWISTPAHAVGWFKGQRPVISTMWEAQSLPEAFRETIDNFEQVIVPSIQNQELFSRYHPNVHYLPLGVDTREWQFVERQAPEREFVFLTAGSGARKGPDLCYKAFKKLWPTEYSWPSDMPVPVLMFKSPRPNDYYGPRLRQIGGKLSDEQERAVYASAHCFLQPSRGEGWGLQPLQAIAQGCPTILTDAHGHKAFSHLGYGISAGTSKAEYFIYGDPGDWWEPSLDELCQQMEYVYRNYGQAQEFARRSSVEAHAEFNWENCAKRFVDIVGEEHLNAKYEGNHEWIEPIQLRYPVRVRYPYRLESCGIVYIFEPGKTTYETADIKRLLFEAGHLDPSCVVSSPDGPLTEEEVGLTPAQYEKIPRYSASHNHCGQCGQVLNSGVMWEPEFDDDGNVIA